MTDLAFLGTGVMGAPMVLRCNDQGFAVHAYNRSPEKAAPLADEGVQVFGDPAEAADGCSVVVTMLADADAVLEVAAAALAAGDPPRLWIQMSTIGPEGTERCAGLAEERDVAFVDAPVLGTRAPAEQGALVVLASGPEAARPEADPVFDAVGARTIWLGEAGAGSTAKMMLNSWVIGIVGALSETLSMASAMGIDPQVFFDAIEGGALDLPYAHVKGRAMAEESFDDVAFALSLARKDAGLVLGAARAHGLELPGMRATFERLQQAEADGHGDEDMSAMYLARTSASTTLPATEGGPEMPEERPENDFEREQERAAAAEAAGIGGQVSSDGPTEAERELSEAERPLSEAGGGESEGFELAESALQEHASHGDSHAAGRILEDADLLDSDEDEGEAGRAAAAGEADQEAPADA